MITLSVSVTNMWTLSLLVHCVWNTYDSTSWSSASLFSVWQPHITSTAMDGSGNKSPNSTFTQRVKRRMVKRRGVCVRGGGCFSPRGGRELRIAPIMRCTVCGREGRGGYRFPPRQGWSQHTWRSEITLMLQLWISQPSSSTLQV